MASHPLKRLKPGATYLSTSPFPDFDHPSHAECRAVHALLCPDRPSTNKNSAVTSGNSGKSVKKNSAETCGASPDVLDSLIGTILSQNTSSANSTAAKRSLDAAFPFTPNPNDPSATNTTDGTSDDTGTSIDYASLAHAPRSAVVEAIRHGGLAVKKAKVIQELLADVYSRHGCYSLQHLADTDELAMRELTSYPGVGPKTAACVLMFALGRQVFAVDTHVFRISKMLGWLPDDKVNRITAQAHLETRVPPELKHALHVAFVRHGRACRGCR
ncbi:hypothetical protein PLICRDRAFT_137401, partial [Plicaturopsis crispa FD-325 SS-3]